MDNQEREAIIRKVAADNTPLRRMDYQRCLIGALGSFSSPHDNYDPDLLQANAEDLLQADTAWVRSLEWGFENFLLEEFSHGDLDEFAYQLGRKIYQEFVYGK